ncbi:hypothetical protein C1N63_00680 [Pantoea ananatis]|nr:hypothetical protein C1N63_00680 [Pantoea ananatis]PZD59499.1 hypothetical protein ARC310_16600 [Pantoea ananatis]PZD68851.1 hypothetical protein ARC311_05645 [Pantoea ananatis]
MINSLFYPRKISPDDDSSNSRSQGRKSMAKISMLFHRLFSGKQGSDCQHSAVKARAGSASDCALSPRHHVPRDNNQSAGVPVLFTHENAPTLLRDYPWQPNHL